MSERSDAELLEAWRRGDVRSGEQLFERHADAIARFFENKVRRGAEDLVQATFLAMLEKRDQIRTEFRAYLFGIARNILRKHIRTLANGAEVDAEQVSMIDLSPGPVTIATDKHEHRLLLEALRHIPIQYQMLLELYYWENLSTEAVGEIMGISAGATRQRLMTARRKLDAAMQKIAASPEVLASTVEGLEGWAAEIRRSLSPPAK